MTSIKTLPEFNVNATNDEDDLVVSRKLRELSTREKYSLKLKIFESKRYRYIVLYFNLNLTWSGMS